MLGTLHSARKALGVTERRARTRTLVTPPIYVRLGKGNGGFIYDMSVDGLALSAAMILGGDGLVSMQILLPDSGGWMEATGQLTWRSESRKTGGIRFVGLPEEARQRIADWLATESSQREPQPEAEILPRPQQHPAGDAPTRTPMLSLADPVDSSTVAEERVPELHLPEDSSVLTDQPAEIVAELFQQATQATADSLAGDDCSTHLRERRSHPRQQIRPLSYIELGRDNGGMLLNISEAGLALIAAMILTKDDLPTIRIQFTGSKDEIEVSGQIAWISESKREAGIRFVNLTEEAREIIVSRISQPESPSELPAQRAKAPDGPAVHREVPEIPNVGILAPVDSPSGSVVQEHGRVSTPPPLAVPGFHGDNVAPALAALEALRPKTSEKNEFKRKSTPAIHPMTSEGGAERRRSLALAVILSGVAAVTIGWIATPPAARNEAIGFIAQNTKGTNKPLEPKNDLSAHETTDVPLPRSENNGPQAHGFDQVPADRPLNGSERHLEPVHPQVRNLERIAARPAVNSAVRRVESALPKSDPAKSPEHAAVAVPNPAGENVRSQVVEASPAQPTESTATPATSLSENIPSGTAVAEVKEKESPPPALKQPNAPVSPTWSVAVSTDPYPSIRIPEDISSQKPSIVRSLQIGRAISRVEPVYPEDAKRQGIEGTVKLHVVVGGDGSIESVALTSGPALLAKAATSAIREWHFGQTLLGGQPVETEQDVVVKFRLAGTSNSKN